MRPRPPPDYSAAVQALEEAGLSQSAQANSNIAIDLGMLEQEETVDLSQLAVQAVQLQQEEEARQAKPPARPTARPPAAPAVRPPARPCWTPSTAPWPPSDHRVRRTQRQRYLLRTLRQGKVAGSTTSPRTAIGIVTFSGTTGYVRADECQTVRVQRLRRDLRREERPGGPGGLCKVLLGTRYVWGGASPSEV